MSVSLGFWFFVALFLVGAIHLAGSVICDCREDAGQEHGRPGRRRLPQIQGLHSIWIG
jgi:hypothetical protein